MSSKGPLFLKVCAGPVGKREEVRVASQRSGCSNREFAEKIGTLEAKGTAGPGAWDRLGAGWWWQRVAAEGRRCERGI